MSKAELEKTFGVKIELESKVGRSYYYKIILPDGNVLDSNVKSMCRVDYICTQYFKRGQLV